MSKLSFRAKMFIILIAIGLISVGSSGIVLLSQMKARDDAEIVNALGRQRMLTQAMGKSALSFASREELNILKNQVSVLNHYITQMRAIYTKYVIGSAKKVGLNISMTPHEEIEPSVPFPATLTRFVNERFGSTQKFGGKKVSIDIIAESPVNPDKGYKDDYDRKASEFLKKNVDKVFTDTLEEKGKLYLLFYTADLATVEACASCHTMLSGIDFKVGDLLGIRKFKLLFSSDIAAGRAQLNPTLDEFNTAKTIFAKTLAAMKSGGEYPIDLKMTKSRSVSGIKDPASQSKINEIEGVFKGFVEAVDKLTENNSGESMFIVRQAIMAKANKLRRSSNDLVTIYATIAEGNQTNIKMTVIIAGIVIVLIIIGVIYFINSSIVQPINRIVGSLSEGAGQVNTASAQISASSQSLAGGSTEQAASLEETSTALDEMAGMTKQNADNANEANSLALDARAGGEDGAVAMKEMIDAMSAISKSSEDISKIIKVIEEIAFQTNLLALNAAVEAARAGEHGKGFAVVAEEVRNLAQRSATAAKDTASLIEDSVKKAEDGNEIVGRVSKTLDGIITGIRKVADLVSEIASASSEQARGVEQVNRAVSEMDKVTQQNAANAEQSAAASEELSAQSESLKEQVLKLTTLVEGEKGGANYERGPSSARALKAPAHTAAPKAKPANKKGEETIPFDDDFDEF